MVQCVYAVARPSLVRLSSSVCRLSVCRLYCSCALLRQFKFSAYFYGIRYVGHPLTSTENFTEVVPREPIRLGS